MKVVIAIDSFKGSTDTFETSKAIAQGIKKVYKDAQITTLPLADGGEGTVSAIVSAKGGKMCRAKVSDPLGNKIDASYGIVDKTAIIEMSSASGLPLVPEEKRNPLFTTTYGTGELIKDAIDKGCRNFIIGIGGSATNDGGVGMLSALGFEFLDDNEKEVPLGARGLEKIAKINTHSALSVLKECRFEVACDVKNVLCGKTGCSAVYGPQKGATPKMVEDMDKWLGEYAKLSECVLGKDFSQIEGTGAAGGLGFAFVAYLGATLRSGIDIVTEAIGLDKCVKNADIVITGEGRMDSQTAMGKAPIGAAKIAKKYNKTVVAIAGSITDDAKECNNHGIDAIFPIVKSPCTLEFAMDKERAKMNLTDTAEQIFRLIKATRG